MRDPMRTAVKFLPLLFSVVSLSLLATEPTSAAIKFKRFPHCPEGIVSKKTCECHAGTSGRYHFCHAGNSCDTDNGQCHE